MQDQIFRAELSYGIESTIDTPKDEQQLLALNKNKFVRIFDMHSRNSIESTKVISYKECIRILKRLDVYPTLISNYDLKLILLLKNVDNNDSYLKSGDYRYLRRQSSVMQT